MKETVVGSSPTDKKTNLLILGYIQQYKCNESLVSLVQIQPPSLRALISVFKGGVAQLVEQSKKYPVDIIVS